MFGADEVHGSERLHNSPRSRHSPRRRRSGERTQPTSSGGFSSRARHADPTDVQGSGRALRRATEVRPSSSATHHQRHHLRSSADRRPGPDPSFMTDVRVWTAWCLGGHTCPNVRSSCPRSHHNKLRREPSQWSLCLPDQWRWTTRQVWRVQQTRQLWLTQQVWRARRIVYDSAVVADLSTVSGPSRFRLSTPTASNLQLLRHDALLKNFGFQPQVLSTVRTAPFEGSHVLGPEPKVLQNTVRTIRQADRMARSSGTFAQRHRDSKSSTKETSSKKTTSRTSVLDRLGSPTVTTTQTTVTQEPPFRAGAGRGARHRPYSDSRKKSSAVSSTRQRWWVPGGVSPGRLCPALADSAGQLPGHRHCRRRGGQCIPATTSADPSVHQLPDQKQPAGPPASCRCLAAEGIHRAGHPRYIHP